MCRRPERDKLMEKESSTATRAEQILAGSPSAPISVAPTSQLLVVPSPAFRCGTCACSPLAREHIFLLAPAPPLLPWVFSVS